jgi:outer membrane protein TolC
LARPPGPIDGRSSLESLTAPPSIPAGLPSTLLKRRPDIRASEKRLLAANARIGVEKADFFPQFQLTGFAGVSSPDLKEAQGIVGGAALFNWTLPFLGGERVRAEYDAAKAAWEGAVADYERTVVNSFREVADSLAAVQTLAIRRAAVQEQVDALETASRIAIDRYRGGVADYLDVLTTEEDMLTAQLELGSVAGQQLVAVARLYRNLGGGWILPPEDDDEDEDAQQEPKAEAR